MAAHLATIQSFFVALGRRSAPNQAELLCNGALASNTKCRV